MDRKCTLWVKTMTLGFISMYIVYAIDKNFLNKTTLSECFGCDELNFNEDRKPPRSYIVPNKVHFVHFGGTPMSYIHMICMLAAFKNQKPDKIYFHYDNKTTFTGKYWNVLENAPGLKNILEFNEIELPYEIFGQPLSTRYRNWHGSDIMRIKIIMKFGGIFLDNDCYVINNLNDYRKYEISVNWDQDQFLGNQVIIAHKNARFLEKWLNTYKVYDGSKWYYNGGERPTVEVLYKEPWLIHRVKNLFGADTRTIFFSFKENNKNWRSKYKIVHLFSRYLYQIPNLSEKATYPVIFNESNIAYYPVTFREMAYDVYDIANISWPKDKLDI